MECLPVDLSVIANSVRVTKDFYIAVFASAFCGAIVGNFFLDFVYFMVSRFR